MDFLNNLFLPPSADHLHLVKYMVLLAYFIHIPFISLLLGGTFFSLFFRFLNLLEGESRYIRIARDFAEKLIFRKTAGIILGIIPLLVLLLIEGQIFYGADIKIVSFLIYATILAATGITLIYFYQYGYRINLGNFIQFGAGGTGLLLLLAGYFVFISGFALTLDPGRWFIVNSPLDLLFSWNVIARYVHFIITALAVSAVAFLFLNFNWKETRLEADQEYSSFVVKVSGGLALFFTLLQPIFIFWNIDTMPGIALSSNVFALSLIVLFILFVTVMVLVKLLRESRLNLGTNAFVLFIVAFIFMIVNDHIARENAIKNQSEILLTRAEEVESEVKAEREQQLATATEPDLQLGEKIFTTQCLTCHRFDEKLVGPPYNEVLPKYEGNVDALAGFVGNPKQVDPGYPPMPNLGLSPHEVQSVATFLLKKFQEERK